MENFRTSDKTVTWDPFLLQAAAPEDPKDVLFALLQDSFTSEQMLIKISSEGEIFDGAEELLETREGIITLCPSFAMRFRRFLSLPLSS